MPSAIHGRELGQYPLSIPTSLALESLTDKHPDIQHKRHPLSGPTGIQALWVNLKTLLRNMDNALGSTAIATIHPSYLAEALLEEMDLISSILTGREFTEYPLQETNIVFYLCDYKGLEAKYPKATVRMDTTEKQKNFTYAYAQTMRVLRQLVEKRQHNPWRFLLFPLEIRQPERVRTAMLTHVAFDLLSRPHFGDLVLLESHTGKIKPEVEWASKYHGARDLPKLPWSPVLLQIFGDAETFRPMAIKLKREVIEIAQQDRWTAITSRDRLKASLSKMKNPYARAIVLSMF